MSPPRLGPKAEGSRLDLLALFQSAGADGLDADDLDAWQERRGILRVERVRLVRDLVDDGKVVRTETRWWLASKAPPAPPAQERIMEPAEFERAVASALQAPALSSSAICGVAPAVPSFTIAEAEEALMLPPGSLQAALPARVVEGASGLSTAPPPATESSVLPGLFIRDLTPVARAPAITAQVKLPPVPPPEPQPPARVPGEPDPASVAGQVLAMVREAPRMCRMLVEHFGEQGICSNTVRGALGKLKASRLLEQGESGLYYPAGQAGAR